ncbi:c-type cytochrome [Comamonas testosteroni]|uniref:c-type cytochrome n=1 Tax=Comamonas testosteroni TaxID=285 RepID=UPI00389ADDB0
MVSFLAQAQGANANQDEIKRGEYLARVGDCVACHSAPGGKPFAGGLALESPIGKIYSTNITPDKKTGIGEYSFEDFDRAVRHGVAKQGHTLYPAMPYTSYAYVKPDDVKAMYAYFMKGVAPVDQVNKRSEISWPMSMRWPLSIWRSMFAPNVVTNNEPVPAGDKIAVGRYLVTGLGHCSTCHTPRGVALQEKTTTDAGSEFLSGAVLEGWLARSLRGDHRDGLGSWTEADIVALLKTGRNRHGATFGSMADVVTHSTQHMTDSDLGAIAAYLKTLPARDSKSAALTYNDTAARAMFNGTDKSLGAMTFVNNCAACHRTSGKGYDEVFPALAQNPTVNADDPSSVIHIILKGAQMPYTKTAPTQFAMPGFAERLSDREVAEVATLVRQSWGNRAPSVLAAQVAKVRKDAHLPAGPNR